MYIVLPKKILGLVERSETQRDRDVQELSAPWQVNQAGRGGFVLGEPAAVV